MSFVKAVFSQIDYRQKKRRFFRTSVKFHSKIAEPTEFETYFLSYFKSEA